MKLFNQNTKLNLSHHVTFFLSVTDDFSNKMRARLLLKQTKNVEEQDDTVLKF